jgi:hypothetical protein
VAIGRPVNTNNPNFYQYGYVTSAATSKYVAFTLLTDGYYALQRQDTSVNGFNINMPLGIQETGASPTYHTYFQGGDQAGDVTYTLPAADGSAGQILSTNGSGVLSWTSASGDITAVGSMTSGDTFAGPAADNNWLGLGAAAGRIEFDDQATDEVNILDANVGIGTSTPADKLSIETNVNNNVHATMTNLSGGTNATAEFQVHNDGGEVGTMVATSTGFTTIPGVADTFAVIGLNKNSFFGTFLGGDVAIGRIIGTTINKDIYIPNATGNVGIGTVAPATKLHVLGYTTIDATDVVAAFSSSDATRRVNIGYDVAGDFGEISAVQTGTGWKNLILARYAGGNVGIRTTSPDFTLDVGGSIRIESANRLYFGGTGAGDTLGNLYHDGTDFVLSDDLKLGTQSALKFADADSSNWVAFKAPATVGANVTWTLPAADGTSGQVLSTNGSGTLSWVFGSGSITAVGSMTTGNAFADATADGNWLGLGAAAGRIEFQDQATDEVNILDAKVGIGTEDVTGGNRLQINVGASAPSPGAMLGSSAFEIDSESGDIGDLNLRLATDNVASYPAMYFTRSRGTLASPTVVQDGDKIGEAIFMGYYGAEFQKAATIRATVDGTPAVWDVPGKLSFYTAPETVLGSEPLERLTIRSTGYIGAGTNSPDFLLDVAGDLRIESANHLYFGGTGAGDTLGNLYHNGTDFVFSDDVKAAGYKSSDGSAGMTSAITVKGSDGNNCTLTVKNGLITATTCP